MAQTVAEGERVTFPWVRSAKVCHQACWEGKLLLVVVTNRYGGKNICQPDGCVPDARGCGENTHLE